jgi:nitrate reductase gamma subunit
MHALIPVVDMYAPLAILVAMLGFVYRVGLHMARLSRPHSPGMATNLLDAPPRLSWLTAIWNALSFPVTRFNVRANPILVTGVIFYHIGIITIAAGYALSVLLLAWYVALGYPVPDISTGAAVSNNLSYSNIFAIIFGCGEPLQAEFLFGPLATVFRLGTWAAVACAISGNTLILLTHLLGRGGAILKDLDSAAKGVRRKGMLKPSHLLVTCIVYSVIWTEILSRLEVVPGIVYLHSILGATLILLLPYTYLFHMVYFPVSVFYAARRWRERCIA